MARRAMAKKILVVDDDPDILDAVTMILESQDYKVVTARDGIEALANLKAERPGWSWTWMTMWRSLSAPTYCWRG